MAAAPAPRAIGALNLSAAPLVDRLHRGGEAARLLLGKDLDEDLVVHAAHVLDTLHAPRCQLRDVHQRVRAAALHLDERAKLADRDHATQADAAGSRKRRLLARGQPPIVGMPVAPTALVG